MRTFSGFSVAMACVSAQQRYTPPPICSQAVIGVAYASGISLSTLRSHCCTYDRTDNQRASFGFTLIELSIVIVIIGLIAGGLLAGQTLISAATLRAQISQIQKFNTATNTFFVKYGYLPGDITPSAVKQFGFIASPTRSGSLGAGDANGEIDGASFASAYSWNQSGEAAFFWEDLSTTSGLIEGGFNACTTASCATACTSNAQCSGYFPYAKIGNGSFVYVYSGFAANCCSSNTGFGPNFFGVSVINAIANEGNVNDGPIPPGPGLTVAQANAIDSKVDDGSPITGNVLAQYLTNTAGGKIGWSTSGASPSSVSCYDTSSGVAAYSIKSTYSNIINCGLSFKMQAGD